MEICLDAKRVQRKTSLPDGRYKIGPSEVSGRQVLLMEDMEIIDGNMIGSSEANR